MISEYADYLDELAQRPNPYPLSYAEFVEGMPDIPMYSSDDLAEILSVLAYHQYLHQVAIEAIVKRLN